MKLLIIANNDVGLFQFRSELIQELLKKHEVTIALPYGAMVDHLVAMGCSFIDTPLERRGMNPITDLQLFMRYVAILKEYQPDLVITYTIKPNIYGNLACRLLHIPSAANITGLGTAFQKGGWLQRFVTWLYTLALKQTKVVFFENHTNLSTFVQLGIVSEDRCCLLNGAGVNLEKFPYTSYPEQLQPIRFLFVGRVMREKGILELLEVMNRLYAAGVPCSLDILGGMEESLSELLTTGTKQGWLRYHGFVTDVRPYIAQCHCFVLPSYHEGMANTNLECAAMGRPLITSNTPGCKEAVVDNVSGFLCESQNADSLYDAMMRFCSLTTQERQKMGLAGRAHVEAVFDKKAVIAQTLLALETAGSQV